MASCELVGFLGKIELNSYKQASKIVLFFCNAFANAVIISQMNGTSL